ncbi:MAG: Panacea domain-containing protein [Chloroflexi bacterium]|nr:Panacea domain-containing protein [Chloroflexota bacterium]
MYEAKAAQAAALFLLKAGGSMPHLKLMKLLYIADRESYRRCGSPITGDEMVSMSNGPVLSHTYDLMIERAKRPSDYWSSYVGALHEETLALADGINEETFLGALSQANRDVIDYVWTQWGRMSARELVKHTHGFREWQDPRGSSRPIDRYELFIGLGMEDGEAEALVERNEEREAIDAAFRRMHEQAGRAQGC